MKLTSEKALEILNEAKEKLGNQGWINHSICVGETAYIIVNAINEKGFNLDPDKAKSLGFVHDIGKMVGNFDDHVVNGYKYLKEQGFNEEYCNICLTHSYLNNDVMCTMGGIPKENKTIEEFIKNHEYTIYEKIINLCDLMCMKKTVTIEKRLIDIIIRRGSHSNTQYCVKEIMKLKKYFDDILEYDLYELFENLK